MCNSFVHPCDCVMCAILWFTQYNYHNYNVHTMQTMITYAIARTNTAIADEKCKGYACICFYTCICVCVCISVCIFQSRLQCSWPNTKPELKQSSGGKRRVSPPQKMRGKLIENIFLGLNLFPQLGLIWISFRSVVCGIIGFLNEQLCCLTSCICFSWLW